MSGSLEVLDGGLSTSIQDDGRFGYRKFGIPVSGAMDKRAYLMANWLAGNRPHAPVLEFTLTGGSYCFNSKAIIAITGTDMQAKIDGKTAVLNQTIAVTKGSILKFGYAKQGCRTYLAIRGKWKIESVMNSYSTCAIAKFGGMDGRPLEQGDIIEWEDDETLTPNIRVTESHVQDFKKRQILRITEGPEWHDFDQAECDNILETPFEVTSQSNRMGIKLKPVNSGSSQVHVREMVSSAVVPGVIQLPESGNPIILMNDCQTTGGYPRIAKIIDADLWMAAQLAPHFTVRFKLISRQKALRLQNVQHVFCQKFR